MSGNPSPKNSLKRMGSLDNCSPDASDKRYDTSNKGLRPIGGPFGPSRQQSSLSPAADMIKARLRRILRSCVSVHFHQAARSEAGASRQAQDELIEELEAQKKNESADATSKLANLKTQIEADKLTDQQKRKKEKKDSQKAYDSRTTKHQPRYQTSNNPHLALKRLVAAPTLSLRTVQSSASPRSVATISSTLPLCLTLSRLSHMTMEALQATKMTALSLYLNFMSCLHQYAKKGIGTFSPGQGQDVQLLGVSMPTQNNILSYLVCP